MVQITRKQHYVSQCITREFANDKERLYEALLDQRKVIPTNCRNSMAESFTYEHTFLETNILEHFFGKFEADISAAFVEIKKALSQYENGHGNLNDIRKIAKKNMKNFLLFYYKSGALLHEFQFEQKEKQDRILYLVQKIFDSRYMNQLSKTISDFYDFAVIKNEEKEFLLSDQFLSTAALSIKGRFFNASNRTIGFKDIVILIPISCEYYLVYYNGRVPFDIVKAEFNCLTRFQTDIINRVIINNSYKKTVSLKREPLEWALQEFEFKSPIGMIAGFKGERHSGTTLKKEIFFTQEVEDLWGILIQHNWTKHYENMNRNELCYCGSGKKLKKCCLETVSILRDIMRTTFRVGRGSGNLVKVNPRATVEKAVVEF